MRRRWWRSCAVNPVERLWTAIVGDALASAVNVAETAARLVDLGLSLTEVERSIAHLYLDIVSFDADQALATAGTAPLPLAIAASPLATAPVWNWPRAARLAGRDGG